MVDRSSIAPPTPESRFRLATLRRVRTSAVVPLALGVVLLLLAACSGAGDQNQPPAAPTTVAVSQIAGGVRVSWTDQSSNESEFIVFRSSTAASADDVEPDDEPAFTELARVPADTVSYDDFDIDMSGSYVYAVAATNQFGTSEQVVQEPSDPISPGVGVHLSLSFDGAGTVNVTNGGQTQSCTTDCVLGVAKGSSVSLTAEGSAGSAFAGWGGDCSQAGPCEFTITADSEVEARFTRRSLHLVNIGDSPVTVDIGTFDKFGNRDCELSRGASCAFGFDFEGAYAVSVHSEKVESQAQFLGYSGACTSAGVDCLVSIEGETEVNVKAIRTPVVATKAYEGLEDIELSIDSDTGLLDGVSDTPGDTHTAVVVEEPSSGTLDVSADGSFSYKPASDANGTVTFQYAARDAYGNQSAPKTVTLNVLPVNDAPTFQLAGNPAPTYGNGVPVTRTDFATNLSKGGGADEDAQSLVEFTVVRTGGQADLFATQPALTITGSTATLTYTPALLKAGVATFEARLKDNGGVANGGQDTSAPVTFTITVSPVVLTLSASDGGTLNPAVGTYEYVYGTPNVSITATADTGYQFNSWSGACSGPNNPCVVTMNGNRSVNATFWPVVTVQPAVGILVNSTPAGINNCVLGFPPDNCRHAFAEGTSVVLAFTSARTVTGVTCVEPNPTTTCTFLVQDPVTIAVQ